MNHLEMTSMNDKGDEIIVNGRPRKWDEATISYEQVVEVGFPNQPPDPNRIYTVTYKKGAEQGTLVVGQSVTVRPGMIFNVTPTNRS
jgi:hypothetical protein